MARPGRERTLSRKNRDGGHGRPPSQPGDVPLIEKPQERSKGLRGLKKTTTPERSRREASSGVLRRTQVSGPGSSTPGQIPRDMSCQDRCDRARQGGWCSGAQGLCTGSPFAGKIVDVPRNCRPHHTKNGRPAGTRRSEAALTPTTWPRTRALSGARLS